METMEQTVKKEVIQEIVYETLKKSISTSEAQYLSVLVSEELVSREKEWKN